MSQSHIAKSRLLEEIIIQLRGRGVDIPANVMSDLKSARTLMQIERADPKGRGETEPKIDEYIANVEAYVMSEAEKLFSPEKVEKWLTALDLASCDTCVTIEKPKEESRFIPGVPRDQKWIRVEAIPAFPMEKLEQLAKETNLSVRRENDSHLIVYGEDKDIKAYIKKMSPKSG